MGCNDDDGKGAMASVTVPGTTTTMPTAETARVNVAMIDTVMMAAMKVWSKVKVEKTERSEFRANLEAKNYVGKEHIESVAFSNGEAKM
jgi:hypothetical protein